MKTFPHEQLLVYGNMRSEVFYRTPAWRTMRYHVLTVRGNRCELCGAGPQARKPLHVDHIKPRFLYPEHCLEYHNLQVLCEDCHIAKGIEYVDDCRARLVQKPAVALRDIFRIERQHLLLAHRPPRSRNEVQWLGENVHADTKKHRRRWRKLVKFCFREQRSYPSAAQIRVRDFMQSNLAKSHEYVKFWQGKPADDFVFEIGGCLFPVHLPDLLADDQRRV
jgi:hypothetical protein